MNDFVESVESQEKKNADKKVLLIGGSQAAGLLLNATAAFGVSVKKVLSGIKTTPGSSYPKKAKKGRRRS